MASFVQGAARTMRAGLQTSTGDGFEAVPALDHSPRREQTPGIEMDQPAQAERDRQRHQERERQRGLDGPDIGRSEEHTSELQSLMRNPYPDSCLNTKQHHII